MSPFEHARNLQAQVARFVSGFDADSLRPAERDVLRALKRQAADVRLDIRDYGMAETKAEQDRLGQETRRRLQELDASIVHAGALGLLGPADVAQLSAATQQLIAAL